MNMTPRPAARSPPTAPLDDSAANAGSPPDALDGPILGLDPARTRYVATSGRRAGRRRRARRVGPRRHPVSARARRPSISPRRPCSSDRGAAKEAPACGQLPRHALAAAAHPHRARRPGDRGACTPRGRRTGPQPVGGTTTCPTGGRVPADAARRDGHCTRHSSCARSVRDECAAGEPGTRCRRSPGSTWRRWRVRTFPLLRRTALPCTAHPPTRTPPERPTCVLAPAAQTRTRTPTGCVRCLLLPDAQRTRWPTRSAARSAPAPGSTSTSPTTAPVAGSVFVRGYAGLTDVTWSGQANGFATSRDLAFLEGLERYAGTHRRRGATLVTTPTTTSRATALDPARLRLLRPGDLPRRPDGQPLRPRTARSPGCGAIHCATTGPILVPARLAYYSAGLAADNFVFECSNGCAIGSCLEEAVLRRAARTHRARRVPARLVRRSPLPRDRPRLASTAAPSAP